MFKWQLSKPHGRLGFTLLEILVAIAISSMLLGALYGVYLTSYKSYTKSMGKAELNQNARIAMERITRDLRQAQKITTSLPPTGDDELNPPAGEIQFQDGHDTSKIQYIRYFLSGGNLHRQVIHYYFNADTSDWVSWDAEDEYGPAQQSIDEDTIRADKITSLSFFGNELITIDLISSDDSGTYNYESKVLGRNIQ